MNAIREPGRPGGQRSPGRRPSDPRRWQGLAYLLGITAATLSGTAFFMGGLLAGAHGVVAIALAAGFPLAGLLWALTLSAADRARRHPPSRVSPGTDPERGPQAMPGQRE